MPDYSAGEAKLKIVPDTSQFRKKLEADLKAIDAQLAIKVAADTGQARADINRFREVAQRDNIKIGIEAKTAEANAELAAWRARQQANNVKIKVNADTGNTLKQVKELQGAVGDIFGTFGRGLKFGITWSGVGELPAVTLALTQAVAAVQQLAQAGLVIPGVFAGIGASIGTLALGLDGVKDAYDAVTKAAETSGQDAAQHAREVTSATNAHRNAVVDEAQAERDRTRAIKDASQALQDLNLQLRGGKISEQQAINNALRQRRDLQRDLATGQIKDQLDLQQRLLDIESADQSVAEAHQRNIELQDKVSEANEKGIANSDQVVAANERVVRSQQQVEQSAGALTAATENQSAAAKAASEAMDKLSPNAKDFVNTLIGMKAEFSSLQDTVQDNLFAGMSQNIKDLVAADLPNLKTGLGNIATAWNGTLTELMKSLGSDSSKGLLDRILGDTAEAQRKFTEAIDPLVHGIGVLTAAGADALPRLADDLKSVADRFNGFITAAADNGSLSKWINDGITGFEHIGNTLLNVGDAFTAITRAAGGGEGLLAMLERGSKALADFLNSTEGQNKLKTWFEEGRREIQEHIIPALKALPGFFDGLFKAGRGIADNVIPPLVSIVKFLSDDIPGGIKTVVYAFAAWKGISGVSSLIESIKTITMTFTPVAKGAVGLSRTIGDSMLNSVQSVSRAGTEIGRNADLMSGKFLDAQKPSSGLAKFSGALGLLGGPAGIITALAVSAIPPLLTSLDNLDQRQKNAKLSADALEQSERQLAGTLQQVTNLAGQKTRDELAQEASNYKPGQGVQGNALQAAANLGINPQDFITAALPGGGQQYGQIQDQLREKVRPIVRDTVGDAKLRVLAGFGADENTVIDAFLGGTGAVEKFNAAVDAAKKSGAGASRVLGNLDLGQIQSAIQSAGGPGLDAALAGQFLNQKRAATSGSVASAQGTQQAAAGTKQLTARGLELFGPLGNPQVFYDGAQTAIVVDNLPPEVRKQFESTGDRIVEPVPGQPRWTIVLGDQNAKIDTFADGGPTPSGRGPGPTGGWLAEVHSDEWVLPKHARSAIGDQALWAMTKGRRFDQGGYIDPNGNPITPGMMPGPSDPIAPNPMGGGGSQIVNSVLSGIGGPISNLTSLIPGIGGQQSGIQGAVRPGLLGLIDAGGNQNLLGSWGQQTASYLGNFGAQFATKFATTLYSGALDFFGLGNSILSPSNPWFQAGAKSLGILNGFFPGGTGGLDGGTPQLGSQSITLGDGSTISIPTFGTSVTSPGLGTGGANVGAPMPDWDAIAQKESGGNWTIPTDNQGQPYRGGLQIWDPTWKQFGGEQYAPTANLASKEQQIQVAKRILAAQGPGAWPNTFTYKSAAVSSTGGGGLSFSPGNFTGLDALAKAQFGLSMTSGYRDPNGPTIAGVAANASYHGQGRAHDYSGSEAEMVAFANFMADNYGSQIKELIFSAPGFAKTIKDGKIVGPFGAFYTLGQAGNHADHVHIAYATGGHTPGSASTPIPAILHGNEFVQRAAAVNKYGVPFMTALNEGRIDPASLPHFADGGPVAYIKPIIPNPPPPPRVPDIQRINPPRAAAVIPSAPTKQLPAPVQAPAPVATPPEQQPEQQKPQQYQGPAPVAPASGDLNHNLSAINTGISSGFSAAGNLAATAISTAAAAGTFGAAGAAGAGGAGSLVAGLFNEAGKIATNLVNVGSSFLVGNVTAGTTPNAYGELNLAPQNVPVTAPDNRRSYVFNGVDGRNIVDDIRLKDAQDMQAQLSNF